MMKKDGTMHGLITGSYVNKFGSMGFLHNFLLKHKYGFTNQELNRFKELRREPITNIENKYISQAKFESLRKYLDDATWRPIVHNKLITANYFSSKSINQPEYFGLLHPRYGHTVDGNKLRNADDLEALVRDKKLKKFVLKHIGGGNGNHVFIIENVIQSREELVFNTIDGKTLNKKDIDALRNNILGRLQGFIVQQKVELHPSIYEITGGGMASVRIYTFNFNSGHCISKSGFIRLGLIKGATDHSGNGGVYCPIEFSSGTLIKGIRFSEEHDWVYQHPNTGKNFENFKIPYWEEILKLADLAANYCPGLNWIGWDFAITPNGPYLLEGNVGDSDFMGTQLLFGGFIENGIYDEWMEELDLPPAFKDDYNILNNWKTRYLKSKLKNLLKRSQS